MYHQMRYEWLLRFQEIPGTIAISPFIIGFNNLNTATKEQARSPE